MSEARFVDPERVAFEAFKSLPRHEPIHMLNLIRFRDVACYPPEHAEAESDLAGAKAYRRYSRQSAPIFSRVGGSIVWSATPRLVLIGPSDERWDAAFVACYPSAAAFLEMVTDEAYQRAVVHRQAAVETSRLIRMAPKANADLAFG